MTRSRKRVDLWTWIGIALLCLFLLFFIYPCVRLMWEAFYTQEDGFTMKSFVKFFSKSYYYSTILNSFKVSAAVMVLCLLIGIPFSYFFTFYKLKGRRVLFVLSLLCTMSAPFIGAYSWIMLLGRSGVITKFVESTFGLKIGSIYGFNGILLVLSLKLFPLVMIYMNGAFQDIDNSLMEASANLGCTGVRRFIKVVMGLTVPTILAAALIVFMRAFADFGTPAIIGEGFKTFPVLIYDSFLSEVGADYNFASAVSVLAILLTGIVFLLQKFATSRFTFTINSLHPIEKKKPKGIAGFLMHAYCYILIAVAILPQIYIVVDSFRDYKGQVAQSTYSLSNYQNAVRKLLGRSITNTLVISTAALAVIIIIAVLIAYLVVRRSSALSHTVDTISMLPYIMPGAVIGISLIIAFSGRYFSLIGTMTIMVIALAIRRMPYTSRSATATMMQIPISTEEASISLGASKLKTFAVITIPQMSSGIISGAILSFVSIVTEMSSGIFLYNNRTITLTLSTYTNISLGSYGTASAFATITTLVTVACMVLYLLFTRGSERMSV
ncbi:MAG: iron ABC transporter permease [Clostridiales bacterium]|jgi:iron(III) transport system permease protein|nr:iron ABC transporter permease [Clostridiales bacterium]